MSERTKLPYSDDEATKAARLHAACTNKVEREPDEYNAFLAGVAWAEYNLNAKPAEQSKDRCAFSGELPPPGGLVCGGDKSQPEHNPHDPRFDHFYAPPLAEQANDDAIRVGRIRDHIAHLRKCADELPPKQGVPFGSTDGKIVIGGEHPSAIRLRIQANDLEDYLEGRIDAAGNPVKK